MSNTESLEEVHSSVGVSKKGFWRKFLAFIGPAYMISVGYMDPGNWATDIAGGSQFGYKLLWVLLASNIIALLLQGLSVRLGVVRGMDLAQVSRYTYPAFINIPLYVLAEIAIVACDLAEVIGMAIGLKLLFDFPLLWGVCIASLDTLLVLLLMKRGIRILEVFIVSMIFIIGSSFCVEMFITKPEFVEVVSGLKPCMLSGEALYISIGIIGATVMPHNLYLHSSLVQTRKIEKTTKGIKEALKFNLIDTGIALNIAFFVNAAILILSAAAFHEREMFHVAEIDDAYRLLESLFGSLAPTLFALALIAAGQSSTVTGTLAGQIVMEGYLDLKMKPWLRRLITRLLAIVPAIFTILYYGDERLSDLLIFSQVLLSMQLGFAVIPLIHFCSDKKYMKEFTIPMWAKILSWASAFIVVFLNAEYVVGEFIGWMNVGGEYVWLILALVLPAILMVIALLLYVTFVPFIPSLKRNNKVIQ